MDKRLFVVATITLALPGCPGGNTGTKRDYPAPKATDVVAKIEAQQKARTGFSAESTMDYWLGKDRLKGAVLVMGTTGKKVRFNALSPAGGNVLADMACDGASFAYVDNQNNCQLTGPCDRQSIATLLHLEVEPEDFLAFAVGTVPLVANDGTLTWDGKTGHETLVLSGPAGKQTLEVDLRSGRTDIIKGKLEDGAGKTVWSIENADFDNVKDAGGNEQRLPGKTRFKAPNQQADLVVEWGDRTLNPDLTNPAKFQVAIPAGLPACGAKAP